MAGSESVAHLLAGALRAIAADGEPDDLAAFIEHRLAVDPPFAAFGAARRAPSTLAGVAIPPADWCSSPTRSSTATAPAT